MSRNQDFAAGMVMLALLGIGAVFHLLALVVLAWVIATVRLVTHLSEGRDARLRR